MIPADVFFAAIEGEGFGGIQGTMVCRSMRKSTQENRNILTTTLKVLDPGRISNNQKYSS